MHLRSTPPRNSLALAALCMGFASCGGDSSSDTAGSETTKSAAADRVQIVALGDSGTSGNGDPTRVGWVGRYARLLKTKLGLEVQTANHAREGTTTADLLARLRSDELLRAAVKDADIVLFGVGGADLNAGDDRFQAGACRAEACYAPVRRSFARNFDAIVATVRRLRGSDKTALRSMTQTNALTGAEDVIPSFLAPIAARLGVYQARAENRAICRAMARHDGRCVDALRAFNGRDGTADAYKKGLMNHDECCYASAKGQQLMAELLFRTGLAPIR
jgi:hypothetical protein